MACDNKGCKIKTNVNPKTKLCPSCETFYRDVRKRLESSDRQQHAREAEYVSRRNIQGEDSPTRQIPPQDSAESNASHSPPTQVLPDVNLSSILKSCEDAKNGGQIDTAKVLNDMLGMMVHMFSKHTETEKIVRKLTLIQRE